MSERLAPRVEPWFQPSLGPGARGYTINDSDGTHIVLDVAEAHLVLDQLAEALSMEPVRVETKDPRLQIMEDALWNIANMGPDVAEHGAPSEAKEALEAVRVETDAAWLKPEECRHVNVNGRRCRDCAVAVRVEEEP